MSLPKKKLSVSSDFVEFLLLNSGILWQSLSPCEPSGSRKLACWWSGLSCLSFLSSVHFLLCVTGNTDYFLCFYHVPFFFSPFQREKNPSLPISPPMSQSNFWVHFQMHFLSADRTASPTYAVLEEAVVVIYVRAFCRPVSHPYH